MRDAHHGEAKPHLVALVIEREVMRHAGHAAASAVPNRMPFSFSQRR
jgi:hypothetical protein